MTEELYCKGCGVKLQSNDPKMLGYIPDSAIEKGEFICKRCFRIKNYNEVLPIEINENDFLQNLNNIGMTDSLVIQVVDLFDIDGSIIHGLHRFIGKNPFIILANKIDLFPKTIKKAKIKNWLNSFMREQGLYPEEIFLTSADNKQGIDEVIEYLKKQYKNKDIYVVGATNVGKSTFINRVVSLLEGNKKLELTTSRFPGTTLNTVLIPLWNNKNIIDTPGVLIHHRFSDYVSPQTLKIISPKKQVKPKVYQLNGKQTLFWGGLARIDQVDESKNSFVCYLANDINIHRTKLNNAENLYNEHLGELLFPPSYEEAKSLPKIKKWSFKYNGIDPVDIVISGLGWITVNGEPTELDIHVPSGIGVHMRKALI